jgi:hypothetical protein
MQHGDRGDEADVQAAAETVLQIMEDDGGEMTLGDIREKAADAGIQEDVERVVEQLAVHGAIFEPQPGVYRYL